jgi:hypothetical protein
MLLFAKNTPETNTHHCFVAKSNKDLDGLDSGRSIPQRSFLDLPKAAFLVTTNPASLALLKRLRSMPAKLSDYCTINQGLRTGDNERHLSSTKRLKSHKPAVGGKNIGRYFLHDHFFVQYEPDKLDAPRNESIFTSPEKLIVQEIRNITLPRRIVAAYDSQQVYCLQSTNVVNRRESVPAVPDLKYLLGLLNSALLNWFFRASFPSNNHIASNQLAELPIRNIDTSKPADKACHDNMVNLVERMLDLHKKLAAAKNPNETDRLQREIEATDSQIDQLVYELYGLAEEEIKIVESH